MNGRLSLKYGPTLEGRSFGYQGAIAGEVVFATGMTGYPEAFTDPSFAGQILVMTYPLIGNYGVPDKRYWESDRLHIAGLIVSTYNETPSHYASQQTLSEWLVRGKVPALEVKDTRLLTKLIREQGTMLGKIEHLQSRTTFEDPNLKNLVARVSQKNVTYEGRGTKTIVQIDCGTKRNITQCFVKRGVRVITIPWNMNPLSLHERFDGVLISNGPGDPMMATETVKTVATLIQKRIPMLGICLGNQILALAAGGRTKKMKFGHRGQNQPCVLVGTTKCYLTTQNHGFMVSKLPLGFKEWFRNSNDQSNEGIIHTKLPIMSVQFHPEANPGPVDTEWIFDFFISKL